MLKRSLKQYIINQEIIDNALQYDEYTEFLILEKKIKAIFNLIAKRYHPVRWQLYQTLIYNVKDFILCEQKKFQIEYDIYKNDIAELTLIINNTNRKERTILCSSQRILYDELLMIGIKYIEKVKAIHKYLNIQSDMTNQQLLDKIYYFEPNLLIPNQFNKRIKLE